MKSSAKARVTVEKLLPMLLKKQQEKAKKFQLSWYSFCFASILVIPALLCQMVLPLVSFETWEKLSEPVYATLLRWQTLPNAATSRVVVLEIDQATLDAYGWPIDRSYYVQMLLKLQELGHPWILSLIQFQALEKVKSSNQERKDAAAKDSALASAIRSYGRFIGSGLKMTPGEELSEEVESELIPRILLTQSGTIPDQLPYFPLQLLENEHFVSAQRAFGYGTHFGTESTIRCMQMYLTDKDHEGYFLIPSSLVWTATYVTQSHLATGTAASWPRPGDRLQFSPTGRLKVSYKHCLSNPGVLTNDFLRKRGIERISLLNFLETLDDRDLSGKVILLASPDMRRFQGPGLKTATDDGIVSESLLAARFLDDLLERRMIRREELSRHVAIAWLPLALAVALSLSSLFLSPLGAIIISAATLGGLLGFSALKLAEGHYLILTPALASVSLTMVGLGILYAYLRYYGARRQIQFANKLRDRLAQCNTLNDLESQCQFTCHEEFEYALLIFSDFDREVYEASTDPARATELLDRINHQKNSEKSHPRAIVPTIPAIGIRLSPFTTSFVRSRNLEILIEIYSKSERLGSLKLSVTYRPHESGYLASLLDILRLEITQHWSRIKILSDQKLLDYRFLMEQTRGDIMERFLTQVLVSKFSNSKSMMENLRTVLTPRPTKAALMQADIRGYSRISAKLEPLEMAHLLQKYYKNVVDAAQVVAQVKLIGDCIFLFIEDSAGTSAHSPADMALELAQLLIYETNTQNAIRAGNNEEPLSFGIAIHYGEVVVGNLSSESCIDYTVIGPNVNMVARLEEFTKNPQINAILGSNGVIITESATANLIRHREQKFLTIDLEDAGLAVRSFSEIKRLNGLTADMASSFDTQREKLPQALAS